MNISLVASSKFIKDALLLKVAKSLIILAVGGLFAWFFSWQYQNISSSIIMIICAIALIFAVYFPARDITITTTEEGLTIDATAISWEKCVLWSMTDLSTYVEFNLQTTNLANPFYYFYIKKDEAKLNEFVTLLTQYIPYNENLDRRDISHIIMRFLRLK